MPRSYKSKLAECALTPRVYTFTYPSPYEIYPLSELPEIPPDEPQFSRTLVSGDFPTITPKLSTGQSCKYFAVAVVSIGNGTASDLWVSYSIYKNETYVCGSTSAYVGAGYVLTEGQYQFLNIAVGDTLTVYASGLGATLYTVGLFVLPTQFKPEPSGTPLFNLKLVTDTGPSFSLGQPGVSETLYVRYQGLFSRATGAGVGENTAATKKYSAMPLMSDGLFWYNEGDVHQSGYYGSSTTAYPYYKKYARPTEISYYKMGGLPR
jgi:hypothetical protein